MDRVRNSKLWVQKIKKMRFTQVELINEQDGIKCAGWKIWPNLETLKQNCVGWT